MSNELTSLETLAYRINEQQARIEQAWSTTLERAKEAGELLIEAKRLAGHGNWLTWLESNCRVSASMAEKYVKIARGWDALSDENAERVPYLSIRDAVKLLAKPRKRAEQPPVVIEGNVVEVVPPLDGLSPRELVGHLEGALLSLEPAERLREVNIALTRLADFRTKQCQKPTTMRETIDGWNATPLPEMPKARWRATPPGKAKG